MTTATDHDRAEAHKNLARARRMTTEAEYEGRALTDDEKVFVDFVTIQAEKYLGTIEPEPFPAGMLGKASAPTATKLTGSEQYADAFNEYLKTGREDKILYEVKAQTEGTDSAGGYLVPDQFLNSVVNYMADAAPMLDVSRIVEGTNKDAIVPSVTTHGTAAWTAEGTAYYESDETFASTTITAYKATRLVKCSEEFVADSAVSVESYLGEELGRSIGALVNTALTTGDGSSKPYGFVPRVPAGQIITGATGQATSVGADDLITVMHAVKSQYRPHAKWMMADSALAIVSKLKDSNGNYIWSPGLQPGQPSTLLGRPVVENPDMAAMAANAKSIAFGAFDIGYYVVRRGSLTIKRNTERYGPEQIGFTGSMRVGADLINTETISLWKNAAS